MLLRACEGMEQCFFYYLCPLETINNNEYVISRIETKT